MVYQSMNMPRLCHVGVGSCLASPQDPQGLQGWRLRLTMAVTAGGMCGGTGQMDFRYPEPEKG